MNKRNIILVTLVSAVVLCFNIKAVSATNDDAVRKTKVSSNKSDIHYTMADNYFLNNNVKKMPAPKITSKKVFDKLFGEAPVMGKNGMPTNIDFSKEYILAVCKPETEYSTSLEPVSLKRAGKNKIIFTYKLIKGDKQTYTIVPCLLIKVKKKQKGDVILKELTEYSH